MSKNLFKLLDEEFELLSGRDFLSVEEIQVQKVERMQELDALWKSVGSSELSGEESVLFDEIRSKLEECRDKHLRNDILLKKQMEITKNLISVLEFLATRSKGWEISDACDAITVDWIASVAETGEEFFDHCRSLHYHHTAWQEVERR